MREIVLDTETTGLSKSSDRITEIGCVELIDKKVTGNYFHAYVNPEMELSATSMEISGLTYKFLKDYPKFNEHRDGFLEFIRDDRLVIHNAPFDVGFLNMELERSGIDRKIGDNVIDTLAMAKMKYPGSPATLDALCRKFKVNADARIKHGALIDAQLLAEVYSIMSVDILQKNIFAQSSETIVAALDKMDIEERTFNISNEDDKKHKEFLSSIKSPIWAEYLALL